MNCPKCYMCGAYEIECPDKIRGCLVFHYHCSNCENMEEETKLLKERRSNKLEDFLKKLDSWIIILDTPEFNGTDAALVREEMKKELEGAGR